MTHEQAEKPRRRADRPFPWCCPHCLKEEVYPEATPYATDVAHDGRQYHVEIPQLRIPKCRACGTLLFSNSVDDEIVRAMRVQARLLMPEQIKSGREALGLKSNEFAERLGVAPETISRWERGGMIQSRAMDNLLRAYFAVPELRAVLQGPNQDVALGTTGFSHPESKRPETDVRIKPQERPEDRSVIKLPLIQPPQELIDILLPAFGPCPGFQGQCQGCVRWAPDQGHVPRGYRGATGRLEEVELVIVCAEPGEPYKGEGYDGPTTLDRLLSAYRHSCWHIEQPRDAFGRNLRKILNIAFPLLTLEEQLRRTWITNAVLCSAPKECGHVSPKVEKECRDRYLLPQLRLFPNARIVALGEKAMRRLGDWPGVKHAYHPVSRLDRRTVEESWKQALDGLQGERQESAEELAAGLPDEALVEAADALFRALDDEEAGHAPR